MKKIAILLITALLTLVAVSQEKGSYISVSGVFGTSHLNYTFHGVSANSSICPLLGGNATIDYSYYFTQHWGLSLGVGSTLNRTKGKYAEDVKSSYFNLGNQIDPNVIQGDDNYELRVRLYDWNERQKIFFIDIPLMVQYQTKFDNKRHGVYFAVGAKVQIPIMAEYKVIDGNYSQNSHLNVSQYFNDAGEIGVNYIATHHGFGTIHNPEASLGWFGDLKLKPSYAGVAEVGVLFGLARRLDLVLGAYFDYGFNNIKDSKDDVKFLEAPAEYLPSAEGKIGEGIAYNGFINSDRTEKVSTMTYGLKAGLKIKLGKLNGPNPFEKSEYDKRNNVIVNPVVVIKDSCNKRNEEIKALRDIEEALKALAEEQRAANANNARAIETMNERTREPERQNNSGLVIETNDIILERVYFDVSKSDIRISEFPALERKVELMKQDKNIHLKVYGNTCDLASENLNNRLGQARAEAVKKYLVSKGIDESRIEVYSNGKSNPVVPNTDESNRRLNRRCDFELYTR